MTSDDLARMPARPHAVVFDVNETLTDLSALADLFARLELGGDEVLGWWFAALLRDGMALAATGDAGSFPELAMVALDEVCSARGLRPPESAGRELISTFATLPVHPDVVPALTRLREARIPAYALTNGAATVAVRILEGAGVRELFADVLSVDAVGHWKPRPEPYAYAAHVAGVDPARLAMVAVHPWDLHGAAAAGLMTGWVRRGRPSFPPAFRSPLVEADDLDGVVELLLGL